MYSRKKSLLLGPHESRPSYATSLIVECSEYYKANFKQEQEISPKGTRHPSLEPQLAAPIGQEILAQLDQLLGEYDLSGNNSPEICGGREDRTIASDSRLESSSGKEGTQSLGEVDDNIVAASPARPAPPTPPLIPLLLSHLLPPLLLWQLLPPYLLPSRHQFPRVYESGLRSPRNGKPAWGLSQNKMKGSPRKGKPLKRGRSRPRGPKALPKIRQPPQERKWELAMPARRSKAMLQKQVWLVSFQI